MYYSWDIPCIQLSCYVCYGEDSHAKDVELVYKLPDEITGLSRIVYRINPQDCQHLWLRSTTPFLHTHYSFLLT